MTSNTALLASTDDITVRMTRRIRALPYKHSTYCAVSAVLAYAIAFVCYSKQQAVINEALYGGGSLLYGDGADLWFVSWVVAALIGTLTLVAAFVAHGYENPRRSY